jgi:hypothetical protein
MTKVEHIETVPEKFRLPYLKEIHNSTLDLWKTWVDKARWTQAIKTYLELESGILKTLLSTSYYSRVVELGCANGSLLMPTVISMNYNYLGIDFSPNAVHEASRVLKQWKRKTHYKAKADVLQADICRIPHQLLEDFQNPKTIIVFPFNIFGSLFSCYPDILLSTLCRYKLDVLIFSYQVSLNATRHRAEYYSQCGFRNLQKDEFEQVGVLFHSDDGLYSYAYQPHLIQEWLKKAGYSINKVNEFGQIGIIYSASSISN